MEFPRRLISAQRALAAALLAVVGGAAWLESRSPVAAAVRHGRPLVGFLALEAAPAALPQLFAMVYHPARRALELTYVPETAPLANGASLARAHAQARRAGASAAEAAQAMARTASEALGEAWAASAPEGAFFFYHGRTPIWELEPPLEAKRWLLSRRDDNAGMGPFERLRLGIELRALPSDRVRAAWLPDQADREAYFARALSSEEEPIPEHTLTAEILNATEKKGVASRATKILRSGGVDVVSTGNAPAQATTVAYDRTGRPQLASKVARMLGCDSAQAVTRIDAKRLVDVSLVIADDCDQSR